METPRNSDPFESIIGTEDLQLLLPVMRKLAPCDNQMESKTLSELYAGVLSRDWEKLLKVLERGEDRVIIYAKNISEDTEGWMNKEYQQCGIIFKPIPIQPVWSVSGKKDDLYQLTGDDHPSGWKVTAEFLVREEDSIDWWLENKCIGYFETKEDKI
jgi:hypothetical protein